MTPQENWQLAELQRRLDSKLRTILDEAIKARADAWEDYRRAKRALDNGRVPA